MSRRPTHAGFPLVTTVVAACLTAVIAGGLALAAQARREFVVSAHRYGYQVSGSNAAEIRVHLGDLVRVTFSAEDVPHTFTIEDDHYRISRRAEPGRPVTFDFRADKPGRFEIFCNLSNDPRCPRETRGVLIVEAK